MHLSCPASQYRLIMSSRYKCVEVIVRISGGEKIKTADIRVVEVDINVANRMTPSWHNRIFVRTAKQPSGSTLVPFTCRVCAGKGGVFIYDICMCEYAK